MSAHARAAALLLVALAMAWPPSVSAGVPRFPIAAVTVLGNSQLIVAPDADAPLCGLQLFLRAGLDRQGRTQSGIAALTAESIVRTPVGSGATLQDQVAQSGGSISYVVEGQYVHFYLEALPDRMPQIIALLGRALAAPDFSAATLAAARSALVGRINDLTGNPLAVAVATFKRSYYTSNAGLPELGSSVSLAALSSGDLAAFFARSYHSGGALATLVGNVPPPVLLAAKALIAGLPPGEPAPIVETGALPLAGASKRVVAHGDTRQPWLAFGFPAPSPGTRDFSAMLVLDALLSRTLDDASVTTPSLVQRRFGSLYLYDARPATFVVYANGLNIEPAVAINQVNLTLAALSNITLTAKTIRELSAMASGLFLTRNLALADRSWMLGNFAIQGVAPNYANVALDAMPQVTSADVRRVVDRYLKRYTLTIVLPPDQQLDQ